ncbi:hypothetical protein AB0J63_25195 [Streptosporangium canum]|uniref:hypothetical protein n=1 Tax=Streptosporangium canum TaxID=324952 RepID=UPI00343F4054
MDRRPRTSPGTDGFGLSGTRESVREHFGVDPRSIADAVLKSVEEVGHIAAPVSGERARRLHG